VLDNLSAHKTKAVEEFLAQHPKVRFHFTPTYSSWLNQVELWFAKIQRDVISRGVFTSVADLARIWSAQQPPLEERSWRAVRQSVAKPSWAPASFWFVMTRASSVTTRTEGETQFQ
jgi:hypothetical protein